MRKFLLHHFLGVRDLLRSRVEVMTNPFDQFSNAIPNEIYRVSLVIRDADCSGALFVMLYLLIRDWWDWMVCSPAFYSENTLSVPVYRPWKIRLHTFPRPFHLPKMLFCCCSLSCSSRLPTLDVCQTRPVILHETKSQNHTLLMAKYQCPGFQNPKCSFIQFSKLKPNTLCGSPLWGF